MGARVGILCLVAALLSGGAQDPPAESFAALEQEFDKAERAHSVALRQAMRAGDEKAMEKLRHVSPARDFVDRFQAGAKRHAGTDQAVPYLNWLLSHGRYGVGGAREALETLLADHVGSPSLESMPLIIMLLVSREGYDRDLALSQLAELATKNPSRAIQAQAHYYRGDIVVRVGGTDEQRKNAARDFHTALELSEDDALRKRIAGALFALERLQVGMVAPEIQGEDLDGVEFKLSDYRGKTVLLDFWGDW